MSKVAHNLFRQEALAAQRQNVLGEIIVASPLSFSLLTTIAVTIVITLITFICCGEYTRKAHVKGYLAPSKGLIKVYSPQAGILIEKHVNDGDKVQQGDTLFILSTERSSRETPEAQATAITRLRQRRESLKKGLSQQHLVDRAEALELQERLRSLKVELIQLKIELVTQEQRVAGARETEAKFRKLLIGKFVAEVQAQEKRDALLDQQLQLQRTQRDKTKLQREISEVKRELSTFELKASNRRSVMERDIGALEQELTEYESRRNIVITAPNAGMVTTILAERGQYSDPETPLLSIIPSNTSLEARLLVPSRAIGFIEPEQTVAIRYQAFPYQRFGSYSGNIKKIAWTLTTPKEANLPVVLEEPVYLATVVLDSQSVQAYQKAIPLRSEMLLEADIWLDHRLIIEWLFEPLLSVKGRL